MGENNIKIAVLSGKGGTGKTLVSVNLAAVADRATYIIRDVKNPMDIFLLSHKVLVLRK